MPLRLLKFRYLIKACLSLSLFFPLYSVADDSSESFASYTGQFLQVPEGQVWLVEYRKNWLPEHKRYTNWFSDAFTGNPRVFKSISDCNTEAAKIPASEVKKFLCKSSEVIQKEVLPQDYSHLQKDCINKQAQEMKLALESPQLATFLSSMPQLHEVKPFISLTHHTVCGHEQLARHRIGELINSRPTIAPFLDANDQCLFLGAEEIKSTFMKFKTFYEERGVEVLLTKLFKKQFSSEKEEKTLKDELSELESEFLRQEESEYWNRYKKSEAEKSKKSKVRTITKVDSSKVRYVCKFKNRWINKCEKDNSSFAVLNENEQRSFSLDHVNPDMQNSGRKKAIKIISDKTDPNYLKFYFSENNKAQLIKINTANPKDAEIHLNGSTVEKLNCALKNTKEDLWSLPRPSTAFKKRTIVNYPKDIDLGEEPKLDTDTTKKSVEKEPPTSTHSDQVNGQQVH